MVTIELSTQELQSICRMLVDHQDCLESIVWDEEDGKQEIEDMNNLDSLLTKLTSKLPKPAHAVPRRKKQKMVDGDSKAFLERAVESLDNAASDILYLCEEWDCYIDSRPDNWGESQRGQAAKKKLAIANRCWDEVKAVQNDLKRIRS